MATWREKITERMATVGDSLDRVDGMAPTDPTSWLDVEFDDGWGLTKGSPFAVWTSDYVYFACVYDGKEWVGRVPRHPTEEPPSMLSYYSPVR